MATQAPDTQPHHLERHRSASPHVQMFNAICSQLDELNANTEALRCRLSDESWRVDDGVQTFGPLVDQHIERVRSYSTKLQGLQGRMHSISDRTDRLKMRAVELLQRSQRASFDAQDERRRHLQEEMRLLAKADPLMTSRDASSSSSSTLLPERRAPSKTHHPKH